MASTRKSSRTGTARAKRKTTPPVTRQQLQRAKLELDSAIRGVLGMLGVKPRPVPKRPISAEARIAAGVQMLKAGLRDLTRDR